MVNIASVMGKGEIANWSFDLPTIEQINEVRDWLVGWMDDPKKEGTSAYKAIVNALQEIQPVLEGKPYSINHRRVRQWEKVMYAMSAYSSGSPHFTEIPAVAYEALSYCYPSNDPNHALGWKGIVMSAVDVTATAIANLEAQAFQQWKDTYESIRRERNVQTRQQRITRELGSLFQGFQEELDERFAGDVRAREAKGRMYNIYQKILRGEEI